uniref:PD-(D/E)XK nuclease superfamily protein n=1 Tax=viral metagenome TaxID=1070528 RepID=A0A6H1ZSK0_9ZZZZ
MAKLKAHIRYRLEDKTIVAGVTTILGLLNKPALIPWANKLGLQGVAVGSYVDDKADIGTLAHSMVTDHLTGKKTDFSDFDPKQISQAENSFLSYLEWEKEHPIKALFVEKPLVHELLKFGGTGDIYGELNGKLEIIDLKTGNGIYKEAVFQVSALKKLLEYHGFPVEKCRILNIPRSEDESFMEKICNERELEIGWKIFVNLLNIYYAEKELTI